MFTMSAADSPRFSAVARTMDRVITDLPPLRRSGVNGVGPVAIDPTAGCLRCR